MMKNSSQATLVTGISSSRQVKSYPSEAVQAKARNFVQSRKRSNRNTDHADTESTGSGEQHNNRHSAEVPFGGSCKSCSTEFKVPAMHTTYASLAKARAARKAAYEEKMLNFRQNMIGSQNQQCMSGKIEKKKISCSMPNRTKQRKKPVIVLGLKRQTNGDLFIASLNKRTLGSIWNKPILGSPGYVFNSNSDNTRSSSPVNDLSINSDRILGHAQQNNVAKFNSSYTKSVANKVVTPNISVIPLDNENAQPSLETKQLHGDDLPSGLTPQTSNDEEFLQNRNKVIRESSHKDKEINQERVRAVNKYCCSADISPIDVETSSLNSHLETAHLANILHELQTTLETLQEGRSPSELELSPRLHTLRKSVGVTPCATQNIRTDKHTGTAKKEPDKRQSGSENSLLFQKRVSKPQPLTSSSQGLETHREQSQATTRDIPRGKEAKRSRRGSTEELHKRILLDKLNSKPTGDELNDKLSSVALPKDKEVAKHRSSNQSRIGVSPTTIFSQPKITQYSRGGRIPKEDLSIFVQDGNGEGKTSPRKNVDLGTNSTSKSNSVTTDIADNNLGNPNKSKTNETEVANLRNQIKSLILQRTRKVSGLTEELVNNSFNGETGNSSHGSSSSNEEKTKVVHNDVEKNSKKKDKEGEAKEMLKRESTFMKNQEQQQDIISMTHLKEVKDAISTRNHKEQKGGISTTNHKEQNSVISATNHEQQKGAFLMPNHKEQKGAKSKTNHEKQQDLISMANHEKQKDFISRKSDVEQRGFDTNIKHKDQKRAISMTNHQYQESESAKQIDTVNSKDLSDLPFKHEESTDNNHQYVETCEEINDAQEMDLAAEIKDKENTAKPVESNSDSFTDIAKAAAQKRDEQRKISAALSRGTTTGGMASTSVPSLLSQPPLQQHQQQQLLQPAGQPQQPSFPGIVPASSLTYTTGPAPGNRNIHTGNTQTMNGDIGNSDHSNHTAFYPNLQNNTVVPALTDGPLYSQVSTQLINHGTDMATPRNGPESPTSRKRRQGRDHTNWAPPPNLGSLLRESLDTRSDEKAITSGVSQEGDIARGGFVAGDETGEEGLQLIVLDKTDDEDEDTVRSSFGVNTKNFTSARSKSDVFPVDRRAMERDMFQQEYTPTPPKPGAENHGRKISRNGFIRLGNAPNTKTGGSQITRNAQLTMHDDNFHPVQDSYLSTETNRSRSMNDGFLGQSLPLESFDSHDVLSTVRINAFAADSSADLSSPGPRNTQDEVHVPPFLYNVTDFDTPQATGRSGSQIPATSSVEVNSPNLGFNNLSQHTPQQPGLFAPSPASISSQPMPQHPVGMIPGQQIAHVQPHQRAPVFAISQVDYDRFTSVPAGISTVREDIGRDDETYRRPKVPDDRTFVLHPDLGTMVPGPGYKFLVDRSVMIAANCNS
ncbi:hypothetical protein ElyMa_005571800 [Elysia marginata]|uniref:Uncharacterized protein n=1 Tax=Elysia marginata TaxID=1093978 RepID=A0AAV4F1X8_9GAST|nr:hypothetical protein ElyMa_005571800 [Elysia marginata]